MTQYSSEMEMLAENYIKNQSKVTLTFSRGYVVLWWEMEQNKKNDHITKI